MVGSARGFIGPRRRTGLTAVSRAPRRLGRRERAAALAGSPWRNSPITARRRADAVAVQLGTGGPAVARRNSWRSCGSMIFTPGTSVRFEPHGSSRRANRAAARRSDAGRAGVSLETQFRHRPQSAIRRCDLLPALLVLWTAGPGWFTKAISSPAVQPVPARRCLRIISLRFWTLW